MIIDKRKKLQLLFVCGGNTCRSPMAVGLIEKYLKDKAFADCAGIAPYGDSPTDEAIIIMKKEVDVDISGLKPKDFDDVPLEKYDFIIAMDSYVYEHISEKFPESLNRLEKWEILDPHLQGLNAYKKCLNDIKKQVNKFIESVDLKIQRENYEVLHNSKKIQRIDLTSNINQLRKDIDRRLKEVEGGECRGTLFHGIASKSVNKFEYIFRDILKYYLNICGFKYDDYLKEDMEKKEIDQLTLGQAIQAFIKMNRFFTKFLRSYSLTIEEILENRRLLTEDNMLQLNKINKLRNLLHHHLHRFEKDESTLKKNVIQILFNIKLVLSGPLFEIVSHFR